MKEEGCVWLDVSCLGSRWKKWFSNPKLKLRSIFNFPTVKSSAKAVEYFPR
jgi:hypothetical protein